MIWCARCTVMPSKVSAWNSVIYRRTVGFHYQTARQSLDKRHWNRGAFMQTVFTDRDGSTGEMYLTGNSSQLTAGGFCSLYRKRWRVEEYHRSLKQNISLAKLPTQAVTTQTSHLFASLLAYIKMERLKSVHRLNHFTLKSKIYFIALKMHGKNLRLSKICNYSDTPVTKKTKKILNNRKE